MMLVDCKVLLCGVCEPCMHVCLLCAIAFLTIELNDECAEEGEVYEYLEEEGQGLATQGKPSTCCISESLLYSLHYFYS
jgi:hypothetical protein